MSLSNEVSNDHAARQHEKERSTFFLFTICYAVAVIPLLYVLSIGPVDWLVAGDYLATDVPYYERPLYSLANRLPVFDRFLDWYVSDVWGVYQPLLR